jgi:hypothetical protein
MRNDLVVTVKVAEVAPAGIETLVGTLVTSVLLVARVTFAPPVGAAEVRVTVPVEGVPPFTLVGFSDTDKRETAAGVIVSVAVLLTLLAVAVMMAVPVAVTV